MEEVRIQLAFVDNNPSFRRLYAEDSNGVKYSDIVPKSLVEGRETVNLVFHKKTSYCLGILVD